MKTRKPFVALVLVFAMIFSLNITPTVSNAATDTTIPEFVTAYISVATPYEYYYADESYRYVENFAFVQNSKTYSALKDDFGIGLKSDGTADIVKDGKGYVSALRLLASYVRDHVMRKNSLMPSDYKDLADAYKKANELMPNYISFDASMGFLGGLSNDGKTWNSGQSLDGSETTGYWAILVDGKYSALGAAEIPVIEDSSYEFHWVSYDDTSFGSFASFAEKENYKKTILGKGETGTFTVQESVSESWDPITDDNGNSVYPMSTSATSGAAVRVYVWDDDNYKPYTKDPIKPDANGKIQFSSKTAGDYMLIATRDVTDKDGHTYSTMTAGLLYVQVIEAKNAKNVKATAKKNQITVTWKNSQDIGSAIRYEVFISKKKNSGYKKKATGNGNKTKATIKKLKKGTYYVKLRATRYVVVSFKDDKTEYKTFKSGFTKPIKVKVK